MAVIPRPGHVDIARFQKGAFLGDGVGVLDGPRPDPEEDHEAAFPVALSGRIDTERRWSVHAPRICATHDWLLDIARTISALALTDSRWDAEMTSPARTCPPG